MGILGSSHTTRTFPTLLSVSVSLSIHFLLCSQLPETSLCSLTHLQKLLCETDSLGPHPLPALLPWLWVLFASYIHMPQEGTLSASPSVEIQVEPCLPVPQLKSRWCAHAARYCVPSRVWGQL
jgi:hypothetical protein